MTGDAHLPQVILAFHPIGGFSHFLHGRQQQTKQNGNDGNDHQELNQRERLSRHGTTLHGMGCRRSKKVPEAIRVPAKSQVQFSFTGNDHQTFELILTCSLAMCCVRTGSFQFARYLRRQTRFNIMSSTLY
jgi:hypothetical protein